MGSLDTLDEDLYKYVQTSGSNGYGITPGVSTKDALIAATGAAALTAKNALTNVVGAPGPTQALIDEAITSLDLWNDLTNNTGGSHKTLLSDKVYLLSGTNAGTFVASVTPVMFLPSTAGEARPPQTRNDGGGASPFNVADIAEASLRDYTNVELTMDAQKKASLVLGAKRIGDKVGDAIDSCDVFVDEVFGPVGEKIDQGIDLVNKGMAKIQDLIDAGFAAIDAGMAAIISVINAGVDFVIDLIAKGVAKVKDAIAEIFDFIPVSSVQAFLNDECLQDIMGIIVDPNFKAIINAAV